MATLTQFQYILAVNRTKHFGRAATYCNVSQPSLSAQIHKVEDELGVTIFDRSKKPILLTQKGAKVIEQIRITINEYNKVFSLSGLEAEVSGPFKLGVIPTLSAYIIPLFIENFATKYPKVKLVIKELQTDEIIERLHADEIDGGLLVTPLHDEAIIEKRIFIEAFHVFASKNHILAGKKWVSDSDLDTDSIWLLDEGHCFRSQVIKVCNTKNRNNALKNIQFESGNLETLKNLIKSGSGYTLLPQLAALNLTPDEKHKHLRRFKSPVPSREVSLVHSRLFLKKEILTALEQEIFLSLPKDIKTVQKNKQVIIEIY